MTLNIHKASDIERNNDYSMLIYAKAGTGKTSMARYLKGKTLVIDIDRTTHVLAGADNIDIVNLDTNKPWQGMVDLINDIEQVLDQYDNIFFDNLSEFENAWFSEKAHASKSSAPMIQDYNAYTYYLIGMIRRINSWKGVNKIFTAWEKQIPIQTPTGQSYNQFVPDIREKILNNVLGLMNVVGRMVYNEDSKQRGFILEPTNSVFAKNQIDNRTSCLAEELFNFETVRLSNANSQGNTGKATES